MVIKAKEWNRCQKWKWKSESENSITLKNKKNMRRKGKVTLLPRTLAGDDENISQTCFWSKTEQQGTIHKYYPWAIQCLPVDINIR